jgi:RNA polymerase sigma factor (sigma-70 family)
MSDGSDSVTEWLRLVEQGDDSAASMLWQRYSEQLLGLARKRLRNSQDMACDEEDLAIGVFASILCGLRGGRVPPLKDRQHWLRIVAWATRRRAVDQLRREHSAKRCLKSEGGAVGVGWGDTNYGHLFSQRDAIQRQAVDDALPAELQVDFEDELEYLQAKLPNAELRDITRLRLEGWNYAEIAEKLGKSLASVERKIRLVKELWLKELQS